MLENQIVRAVEQQQWIDRTAEPIQRGVRGALNRVPVVRDFLHGKWLGHPLHSALTDFPIGAWSAGMVLDLIELGKNRRFRKAADVVHTIGLVSALGAAAAGIADYSRVTSKARRAGFIHGATNMVIAGLFGASLLLRSRGKRSAGIALSTTGFGLMIFSAWLGGEMTYRYGVGVRREAIEAERSFVDVAREEMESTSP